MNPGDTGPSGCPDETTLYLEEEVSPGHWAKSKSAQLGRIRFGQVYHYKINSLTLPGSPPPVRGQPPFVATPYAYKVEHKDTSGSLGPYEWTQLPQHVLDTCYAVPHWAFITRKPANLLITSTCLPKTMEVEPYDGKDSVRIDTQYLHRIRMQSEAIRVAYHYCDLTFEKMQLKSASTFNFEWALGTDWQQLMEKAEKPLYDKELRNWTHNVRRRMLDGLTYTEFSMRQMIHHLLYLGGYEQPAWPTESRFVGVIVAEQSQEACLYGPELAKLGAPVWTVWTRVQEPPLQIMPPGAAQNHPICRAL